MKNKGFTLIELLAVITVLGFLIVIIIPTVNKTINDSETTLEQTQINEIINATKKYVLDNTDLLPESNHYTYIRTQELVDNGIIDNDKIINPKTKEIINGCILISYNDYYNQYEYEYKNSCVEVGTTNAYDYTGDVQNFKAPLNGYYKLEVWGAQGGYRTTESNGGKGGYATGIVHLSNNENLYVYVGGSGNSAECTNDNCPGGYNGGGYRYKYKGGGGATDIRLIENSDPLNSNSLLSRIIVAGGGGSDGATNKTGMYGGGTQGGAATQNYGSYGYGGTQTGFTTSTTPTQSIITTNSDTSYYAGFGFGGYGISRSSGYAGAGGGGWYGGVGSKPDSSGDDDRGGGGGSGFVYTSSSQLPQNYQVDAKYQLTNTNLIAGNASMPSHETEGTMTGNLGNGYAKITYMGESM